MDSIFHITSMKEWEKAKQKGDYSAPSLDKEGFIHCSYRHQIPPVANFNFKGQRGLVLLEINVEKLIHEVKIEGLYNERNKYPHVYGTINLDAVVQAVEFPPEADGTFKLPSELY